ncbi:acyl-CoA/acyl-ACP dehydrogenase [Frankia sp. AiPs1]|uniref:acyl-CoA dehydrogenase family protein n=1 Tax=Frankia sp. AiPs1 TaxID=573493 RepID=UPI0020449BF2|nr:acyl-CoA dehydrogenase family protein [Frankia sp. AiPs1]MCM3920084.1 acyl-CoA/acyl-ACP dehydrogenase [Frankia sp. AiPs1]
MTTTAAPTTPPPGTAESGAGIPAAAGILDEEMLARFDRRAPSYDRENRFFTEDFDELRACGYLDLALPAEFGGPGRTLAEIGQAQRRLAYHAPATAIAVNMHFYWTGLAADLLRAGDRSCAWILERAAAGDVFAAGHGEAGNDVPILASTTTAERVDGGWEFTGHKIFGSLSPVWDWFGIHGTDLSDPANPRIVHGFIPRSSRGYRIEPTWDVLGMRATESNDTLLDHAFVADEHVPLVCPAGFAGAGPFQVGIFAWALLGFANVYAGIAQRAFDLTVAKVHQRTSIALTRSMAYHPEVQHEVAEMRMDLETVDALLAKVTGDWSTGVDHGADWPLKIIAAKHVAVTRSWRVVDTALDLTGGAGVFRRNRMEQLFRDARMGRFHPANSALTHELVAKFSLGINPDEQPRWG